MSDLSGSNDPGGRSAVGTIVVVGASLAGLRAVETLRHEGYEGRVLVVGDEPHLPYDRPPLSKEVLAGEWEPERLALRQSGYEDLDAEWLLGCRAVGLDAPNRIVELHDGARLAFDGAVIAAGASPRTLPDAPPLAGIFTLRTLDDAMALRELLAGDPRVVVVGGGFIGAEVAATCRRRGLRVTVLEMLPQPMVRGVGPVIGETLGALHRDHGVDLRCGIRIEAIEGDGRVERVRLGDGDVLDADVVLVAIGVAPNTAWLEGSGLTLDNGIVCDDTLLAAPGVVAAGDVARWPNRLFDGELMRIEHWTNATEQGVAAARRLLAGAGEARPFAPVPFVWSDQYDVKIQCVGRFRGDDEMRVVDGSLDERKFVAVFGRAGRLSGVIAFNRPRLLMQYRMLLTRRASFEDALAFAPD